MLHEILLSLSGHPSALFDTGATSGHVNSTTSHLLSPPEAELLSSIGHLSRLHRKVRDHAARIATTHPSTVCRAVAAAVTSHHLESFQRKILDVESRILKQDASTVGAYNIVPLAGIVGEFSEWIRLLEWLWELSTFMLSPHVQPNAEKGLVGASSGAQVIDKLRMEAQTGHPTIEEAANQLGDVAETSWLRQLSTWLLYGRLPSFGAIDFFVHRDEEDSGELLFVINHQLLPKFVTRQTASSILFVGKSLNQIRSVPPSIRADNAPSNISELDLLPSHVEMLSVVRAPIIAAELAEAVTKIRLSLSRNLLQYLLPRNRIIETLTVLHQFFLLGRGEFAMTLITEADARISARHRGPLPIRSNTTKGVVIREAEISQTLARSLAVLSTLSGNDEHTDDILEVAARVLHLTLKESPSNRPGTPGRAKDAESVLPQILDLSFNELLLLAPCSLFMDVPFPLDLFITRGDVEVYSSIHAYLLAIRRAHLHLAQLWRQSSIRRDHPCPPGYQYSNSAHGKLILDRRRRRAVERTRSMRKVWATCAAAVFFLAESEDYFQGTVVQGMFDHFLCWVDSAHSPQSHELSELSHNNRDMSATSTETWQQHDPEALGLAHRRFLSSVGYSLLLTDPVFSKSLRNFCTHVDELVAYIARLTGIQQNLDLEEDEGIEDFAQNYKKEEKDVLVELDRARKRLDGDLKGLVERLREIDNERIGASVPIVIGTSQQGDLEYDPLRVGGIDRLLMKLDWGSEYEEADKAIDLL
ncbi:spindle pole body subunit [Parastagonospora nodorum]|nr:spindle pole body subunit [Parastagonospora nodorum]QRC97229.1 spindle pole body subunit [Parastagonospora nodorum SN15]KAH3922376.1 spindle pole body subunit [Parastagonospora nodorum]KAH3973589.1 spindle pole body subunit [Parastagonospora nodorum]KAH4106280.1 spindle pole body subunit [Parastagonospora nodorum]